MKKESSGTEKAEKLSRTTKSTNAKKPAKKSAANKSASSSSVKKSPESKTVEKKTTKKEAVNTKKAELAKIKAEKRQKRLEKKLEAKQKRLEKLAAYRDKIAERKAKKRERKDFLKHETKEARAKRRAEEKRVRVEAKVAKRKAAAAERQARRDHRLKVRAEKRADRKERQHAPGFGGWLAATIALGVTTLALGSMLTFGWISFNGMQAEMTSVHTQSLYELNSIFDNLDSNLSKVRIASSSSDQVKLLSDIAIESEMAETVLERIPVETRLTQQMTSFVNKMGDSAQSMLQKVARGEKLSKSEHATLSYMYTANKQMKQTVNELTAASSPKEMWKALKGKEDSLMIKSFGDLENTTIETPKEINDGPFSDSIKKVGAKNLDGLEEISATKAEELAKQYFSAYKVSKVKCTGETVAQQLECFNLALTTPDGEMMAQLSKKGGRVIMFDSYKDCSDKNFSVERCIDIAKEFLASLNLDGMEAVWSSENGVTCNLNFAYSKGGVVYYPDMIKIKVCEERGIVTGMEGLAYALNHTEREEAVAKIDKQQAQENLAEGFEFEGGRLAVIPLDGNEVLTYEFFGTYDGSDYYIYIDAATGEEVQVLTVVGTKQGRALM